MAVKRRHCRSRSRKRRTHWKLTAASPTRCPECGKPVEAHRACRACGAYGGRRDALKVRKEKEKS